MIYFIKIRKIQQEYLRKTGRERTKTFQKYIDKKQLKIVDKILELKRENNVSTPNN